MKKKTQPKLYENENLWVMFYFQFRTKLFFALVS